MVRLRGTVGFTQGTYAGFVELQNLDGSEVTIEAGSATNGYTNGTGNLWLMLHSLGFNEFSKAGVLEGNRRKWNCFELPMRSR